MERAELRGVALRCFLLKEELTRVSPQGGKRICGKRIHDVAMANDVIARCFETESWQFRIPLLKGQKAENRFAVHRLHQEKSDHGHE